MSRHKYRIVNHLWQVSRLGTVFGAVRKYATMLAGVQTRDHFLRRATKYAIAFNPPYLQELFAKSITVPASESRRSEMQKPIPAFIPLRSESLSTPVSTAPSRGNPAPYPRLERPHRHLGHPTLGDSESRDKQ